MNQKSSVAQTLKFVRWALTSDRVADMSLATPQAAIDGMTERLKHPIFGYTCLFDDDFYDIFNAWTLKQYDWSFPRDAFLLSSGVIPALYKLVGMRCSDGDKVLTLSPAYGYFNYATAFHKCDLVTSALIEQDGRYEIDFDDFSRKATDPKIRVFFLCHTHNPTGRIWTEVELRRLAEICFENSVLVVSDEIHCDLRCCGKKHTPLTKLFPASKSIITCMAPSKTFNLAGMKIANVIIPDRRLRDLWNNDQQPFVNPMSLAAAQGAYENGEAWLVALRAHLTRISAW